MAGKFKNIAPIYLLNMKDVKFLGVTLLAILVLGSSFQISSSQANTIDYGSLQDLFGEPITVTATGKPQKSSESPVAIEIITAEQIRRQGVTTIAEVLGRAPGLSTWFSTRSNADVGIRGQNANLNPTLLVMINGRQVYNDIFGYTDWSLIPVQISEIRQIEVVKGPATALYGFNAVSGVVNIVTYNPKYDNVSEAGVTAGTGDYGSAYAIKTAKVSDKASVRVSASTEQFDEFEAKSKTPSFAQQGSFGRNFNRKVMADGIITISDKTELRIETSYDSVQSNDSPTTYYTTPAYKTFWSGKVDLTSDTSFGLIRANIYNNNSSVRFTNPGVLNIKGVDNVTVAQLQDLFKVGTKHSFRVQAEYRHNTANSNVNVGPGADVFYDLVAADGMWNWAITPEFELTNSARVDHVMLGRDGPIRNTLLFSDNDAYNNKEFNAYSSNNSAVWKATSLDTFRLSYGRGIQSPSLFNLGLLVVLPATLQVPLPTLVSGNPSILPTIVTNYEAGYDRLIEPIGGKLRTSVFYKKTKGINDLSADVSLSMPYFVKEAGNVGNSETGGVELGLDGKVNSNWNWDASYIFQSSLDHFTVSNSVSSALANSTAVNRHFQGTLPRHTVKAHLGYKNGRWETDAYGEIASHYDTTYTVNSVSPAIFNLQRIPGYYTMGGRVAYLFDNNITVSVFGSGLTQARVQNGYGLENERRVFLSLSKKF